MTRRSVGERVGNGSTEAEHNHCSSPGGFTSEPRRRRSRWRGWLIRLSVLCLSMVLALIAGEIGVRVFKPQVMFPRYVTDSDFGIRVNVPDARYWHTSPEVRVQFRINSMGIRAAPRLGAEGPDAYLYRRRGHFHWTPRAHDIAAELLTEALAPILEAVSTGPPRSRLEPESRWSPEP